MKNGLNIWSWLASIANWHVVVINVCVYFAASGAVVAEPRFVEAAPTPPRHERAKILNGGLQSREVGSEKSMNVIGPSDGFRVDGPKLAQNRSPEGSASGGAANLKPIAPINVTNERGEKKSAKDGVRIGDDGFDHWFWVYVAIALYPLFMANAQSASMKHNVIYIATPCGITWQVGAIEPALSVVAPELSAPLKIA